MTRVEYRVATLADAPAIASLHAASWRRTYRGVFRKEFLLGDLEQERLATWSERLRASASSAQVILAADDGGARGFVCAFERGDSEWGVFIDNLHVAPSHQGAGVGTALLATVARWASRVRPTPSLYLWVLESNAPARAFYERRGASQREATVRENPGGGSTTYLRYAWEEAEAMVAATRAAPR